MSTSPEARQAAGEWWNKTTGGTDTGWHKEAFAQGYDAATAKLREESNAFLVELLDYMHGNKERPPSMWRAEEMIGAQLAPQQPSAPSDGLATASAPTPCRTCGANPTSPKEKDKPWPSGGNW